MALSIPVFPNPFDQANPVQDAYAWIAGLALDLFAGTGRVVLNVHPNAQAWGSQPLMQMSISLGDIIIPAVEGNPNADPPISPVAAVFFPTLGELMQDPEFASAYAVIGGKLYGALKEIPVLSESIDVM